MILFTKNQLFVPWALGKILIETVRHTQNEISHSLQELEYDKYCESLIFLRLLCKSLIIFYLQTTLALKILWKNWNLFFFPGPIHQPFKKIQESRPWVSSSMAEAMGNLPKNILGCNKFKVRRYWKNPTLKLVMGPYESMILLGVIDIGHFET